MNCFSAHERVILVFISLVASETNTKITLSGALKQFVTQVHTLFSITTISTYIYIQKKTTHGCDIYKR